MAIVAIGLEDYDRVLDALDRCEKLGRPFPIADYLKAVAYNQLGDPEKALAAVERFEKVFGKDAEVLYERGQALEQLEQTDEALNAYRQGLEGINGPGSWPWAKLTVFVSMPG